MQVVKTVKRSPGVVGLRGRIAADTRKPGRQASPPSVRSGISDQTEFKHSLQYHGESLSRRDAGMNLSKRQLISEPPTWEPVNYSV